MGVNVHQEDGYYCLLNIVAVGGGGGPAGGDGTTGGYGGGGSGLVLHQAIQMLGGGGNDEFVVKVVLMATTARLERTPRSTGVSLLPTSELKVVPVATVFGVELATLVVAEEVLAFSNFFFSLFPGAI